MSLDYVEAVSKNGPAGLVRSTIAWMDRIPYSLVALAARFGIGLVFWQSGRTKVDGFRISDSAIALFQEEYKLPFLDPTLGAHLAAIAEHLFPLLLFAGLASRFSALALLGMTMVIQIFVYPDAYATHLSWAGLLLIIIARGPGVVSLDHLIARRVA